MTCKYYYEGKCRCMNSIVNQDFYTEPLCEDTQCEYKLLQEIKKIALDKLQPGCSMRNECDYSCNICHLNTLWDIVHKIEEKE